MDLRGPAVSLAGAYLRGANQAERLLDGALRREIGPATAQFLGILALKKIAYGLALGAVCRADPWVLPPGVGAKGLNTEQLADAVLGLSPADVLEITDQNRL